MRQVYELSCQPCRAYDGMRSKAESLGSRNEGARSASWSGGVRGNGLKPVSNALAGTVGMF